MCSIWKEKILPQTSFKPVSTQSQQPTHSPLNRGKRCLALFQHCAQNTTGTSMPSAHSSVPITRSVCGSHAGTAETWSCPRSIFITWIPHITGESQQVNLVFRQSTNFTGLNTNLLDITSIPVFLSNSFLAALVQLRYNIVCLCSQTPYGIFGM